MLKGFGELVSLKVSAEKSKFYLEIIKVQVSVTRRLITNDLVTMSLIYYLRPLYSWCIYFEYIFAMCRIIVSADIIIILIIVRIVRVYCLLYII